MLGRRGGCGIARQNINIDPDPVYLKRHQRREYLLASAWKPNTDRV